MLVISVFSAELGGMMGLCLGASILSVSEFVEFLVVMVTRACTRSSRIPSNIQTVKVEPLY